ncbi:lipopolysaccharide biosynthesis protein [Actinoplanes teichomyceticus]|uniref:O-antigen/teichoic acid export membrane protein n=1 Tax=Actinoplanes teichomyceticus TaxID=1867 RepID=A0A561VG75_ACTTI|nr:hypothetical protein [Actinoplanes teichomyceticus]TWG10626.1 O-antigen/teichoic acid export membrane protein [Actinoplanes teichomyceticus]GIF15395.1 hypothetical protein Ate01nite_54270 [Actinoplanes teichomyceticus]
MSRGRRRRESAFTAFRRSRVVAIAGSILGTQVVTSALGFVYWTVAARTLSVPVVGHLGSATAAAMLLGMLGMVGCGTLLISHLPELGPHRQRVMLVTAIGASAGVTAVLSVLFGLVAWRSLPAFAFLDPAGGTFWLLVAVAVLTALGNLFDQAMLVLGRPSAQVTRNAVASASKIVLLGAAVLAGRSGVDAALGAWLAGQLVACLLAVRAAVRLTPTAGRVTGGQMRAAVARFGGSAGRHHGMNIALAAPAALQPVIISAFVTADENAVYTTVRLVATVAFMAPYALAMALFAVSANDRQGAEQRARSVFRLSLAVSLLLSLVLLAGAPLILRVFGADYAHGGMADLRLLGLACPLLVVKDQYIARVQADRVLAEATPFVVVTTVLEIAGTVAGAATGGLTGSLVGWLLALAAGALWLASRHLSTPGSKVRRSTAGAPV